MGKRSSKSDGTYSEKDRYSERGWIAQKQGKRKTGARSIRQRMKQVRAQRTSDARPSRSAAEGREGAGGPPTIPLPIVPEEVRSSKN